MGGGEEAAWTLLLSEMATGVFKQHLLQVALRLVMKKSLKSFSLAICKRTGFSHWLSQQYWPEWQSLVGQ